MLAIETVGVLLLALAMQAPQEGAKPSVARPTNRGMFATIRAPSRKAAPAQPGLQARARNVLQWSLQPGHQPATVPRPTEAIVFPNIGVGATPPPRPAGTRGSNYVAPTLRPSTRRSTLAW